MLAFSERSSLRLGARDVNHQGQGFSGSPSPSSEAIRGRRADDDMRFRARVRVARQPTKGCRCRLIPHIPGMRPGDHQLRDSVPPSCGETCEP